jgi:prophage maintenance system killer protein
MKKIIHKNTHNNVFIYQAKSGALELKGDIGNETIWATQAQIVTLFGVDQSVVSRHIRNVFTDGEVDTKSNMQKMHIANSDKPVTLYSLDLILAVGYRTNSSIAIEFRKWATKTLKEYITKGFVINRKMIAKNYEEFSTAVTLVKKLLPTDYHAMTESQALDLATLFARTWLSLDAYDKSDLRIKKTTKKKVTLTTIDLTHALALLKNKLIKKGEATELFGTDRNSGSLEGIVGNVMQSFGGTDVYDNLESKAAHLLYFVVKNHPFVDGNKRSGAFAFVWFLEKVKILDIGRITPEALTALTLLVAESNPSDKENIIKLIMKLIEK